MLYYDDLILYKLQNNNFLIILSCGSNKEQAILENAQNCMQVFYRCHIEIAAAYVKTKQILKVVRTRYHCPLYEALFRFSAAKRRSRVDKRAPAARTASPM